MSDLYTLVKIRTLKGETMRKLYTIPEAATLTGLPYQKIYYQILLRNVDVTKPGGKKLITEKGIEQLRQLIQK